MQKYLDLGQAALGLLVAAWVLLGVLANVLPDGKAKTACSYAGMRLGKAISVLRGQLPSGKDGAK